jgi:integrase/recombinase XerD
MADTQSESGLPVEREKLVEAFDDHLKANVADETRRNYTRHASDYLQWVESHPDYGLFDINPSEIKNRLGTLLRESGYSTGTISIRRSAISKLYESIEEIASIRGNDVLSNLDSDDIPPNPAHKDNLKLDFPAMDQTSRQMQETGDNYVSLDHDDVVDLVENVPPPRQKNQLIVRVMYRTGVRVGELTNMRIHHFDDPELFEDPRTISVPPQKSKFPRTVRYPPVLASDLESWVNGLTGRDHYLRGTESEYLFPNKSGNEMSTSHINKIVRRAAKGAGIQRKLYEDKSGKTRWKVTAHSLRHSYAESMVSGENPMDIRTLAVLMGHRTNDGTPAVETTAKYLEGVDVGEKYRRAAPPPIETDD